MDVVSVAGESTQAEKKKEVDISLPGGVPGWDAATGQPRWAKVLSKRRPWSWVWNNR